VIAEAVRQDQDARVERLDGHLAGQPLIERDRVFDRDAPRPRDVIKLRASDEYAREYSEVWNVLGEEFTAERAS
jgi:hypothetical protein